MYSNTKINTCMLEVESNVLFYLIMKQEFLVQDQNIHHAHIANLWFHCLMCVDSITAQQSPFKLLVHKNNCLHYINVLQLLLSSHLIPTFCFRY